MQFKLLVVSLLSTLTFAAPTINERTVSTYAIRNFTRNCTNPRVCTYYFVIDTVESQVTCTIVHDTRGPKGDGEPLATNTPWANIPCQQDGRWVGSWGWDYKFDFTVLTIVHKPNNRAGFFGYNTPNVGLPIVTYADNGPNPVQQL